MSFSLKATFVFLISSSSSSSPLINLLPYGAVDASPLPSNALNRWRESSPAFVRGGETAVATVSMKSTRSSGGKIIMDNTGTGSRSRGKPRKRRKKKSSTKKKQTMKSATSNPSSPSSLPLPKTKPVEKSTTTASASSATVAPTTKNATPTTNANNANPESMNNSNNTTPKKPSHDQMPSIFEPEELIYDKYAACLAATEGLRRIRDSKLQENQKFRTAVNVDADKYGGWKSLLKGGEKGKEGFEGNKSSGDNGAAALSSSSLQKEGYKRACAEYVLNSSKVVKALGLSVSQFNQLGREVKKNKPLREKVRNRITYPYL